MACAPQTRDRAGCWIIMVNLKSFQSSAYYVLICPNFLTQGGHVLVQLDDDGGCTTTTEVRQRRRQFAHKGIAHALLRGCTDEVDGIFLVVELDRHVDYRLPG